jgi:hypothetical protein
LKNVGLEQIFFVKLRNWLYSSIASVGKNLRRQEDFLYLFGMDLIDFDVEKNKKNIARFQRMAAKNCFWSRIHKYSFFSKRFFVLINDKY